MWNQAEFGDYVQDVLLHLYDYAHLQTHPLTLLVTTAGPQVSLGHALHRLIQDVIQSLKPSSDAPPRSESWRAYHCLRLRYLEMMAMSQIADELGISPRSCRRAHRKAQQAVVSALWERYVDLPSPTPTLPTSVEGRIETTFDPRELLQSEAARLTRGSNDAITDVTDSAESIIAMLNPLAHSRGARLSALVPRDTPALAVSRTYLRQILLGALHCSIDWMGSGQAVLTATASDQCVILSIAARRLSLEQDLPPDRISTSAHLQVARQLVESCGGTIAVESEGSRLQISLSLPSRRPITVLVVDDNPDTLSLFRRYLGAGGYRVLDLTDGEQALRLAREIALDIIILDLMMPEQDGWEILQLLRTDPSTHRIPVVVCSVLPEHDLALALGAAAFLPKPLSRQQLLEVLKRYVA